MTKLFRYLKKRDALLIPMIVAMILGQVWLDLKLPDSMSKITQLVQTEGSAVSEIVSAGGTMLLCALGSLLLSFLVGLCVAKIAAGLAMRIRESVYCRTIDFSMEELGRFSTASLITRTTNDITQIQTLTAMGLQAAVKAPILAVWAVVKISGKSWQWTAVTGGAVLLLLIMLGTLIAYALPKFTIVQHLTDNLNRVTRENLTGLRVVRAYNAEDYQAEKFEKANGELTQTNLFINRLMAIMNPGMTLIMSALTLGVYWVGAYLIDGAAAGDKLSLFSDMVVFSSYAMQIVMAFMMLTMSLIQMPRAIVSARRINEILETAPTITDGQATDSELYEQGELEFQHVSFRYPGAAEDVLHDVSFTARKGETIAFIGSTGSGKSTIVNLIPRFYDVTDGRILVDSIDVRDYVQEALRKKIGYVPQQAVMFSGTIASNLTYGQSESAGIDEERLSGAIRCAQAEEFVLSQPDGYHAAMAQGGTNFSGGQKQRLSIARAVYRQPEILIFDDSFSALDYTTDRLVRSALKKQTEGITTLIVAQRIGTIRDADKIIVLDQGRVVGQGTHSELLKSCTVYQEIARSQLTKEEMNHG